MFLSHFIKFEHINVSFYLPHKWKQFILGMSFFTKETLKLTIRKFAFKENANLKN